MNYKIGQKLVCIKGREWSSAIKTTSKDPKEGDIVIVEGFSDDGYLKLVGYGMCYVTLTHAVYNPTQFRPLINISAVNELINIQTVKETSDYPIQIPETA